MFHEDGSSDFLLGNNYWEPSLDCRQDGSVEQIYSGRELAERRGVTQPSGAPVIF